MKMLKEITRQGILAELEMLFEEMKKYELPQDLSLTQCMAMLETAKKALGLCNKLKDPAEKKKHLSRVMTIMNKCRGACNRIMRTLPGPNIAEKE